MKALRRLAGPEPTSLANSTSNCLRSAHLPARTQSDPRRRPIAYRSRTSRSSITAR
jgi:hypothetical protein